MPKIEKAETNGISVGVGIDQYAGIRNQYLFFSGSIFFVFCQIPGVFDWFGTKPFDRISKERTLQYSQRLHSDFRIRKAVGSKWIYDHEATPLFTAVIQNRIQRHPPALPRAFGQWFNHF